VLADRGVLHMSGARKSTPIPPHVPPRQARGPTHLHGHRQSFKEEGRVKILIAEDDAVTNRYLQSTLGKWGYEVIATMNGAEAWRILESAEPPRMAILDWMMPQMDGLELCRKIRETPAMAPTYVILLTARGGHSNAVQGLDAGADDYVTKPFDYEELRARVKVGARVAQLQASLAERVSQLEEMMAKVKQLRGLLPICSYCKKIRDDRNYWQQVEGFISEHSEAQFSHGICPDCYAKFVKPELEASDKDEKS
jgi:phosphoserine phosphatase RsbU/P